MVDPGHVAVPPEGPGGRTAATRGSAEPPPPCAHRAPPDPGADGTAAVEAPLQPSPEQHALIDARRADPAGPSRVLAFAGAGKTTALRLPAEADPSPALCLGYNPCRSASSQGPGSAPGRGPPAAVLGAAGAEAAAATPSGVSAAASAPPPARRRPGRTLLPVLGRGP